MLKVHRTLPCKLELLLFLTRKNLHSGEAVPGVRCEVWRCYWSCWNAVKCNQFKRCKRNQYPYRSCHKFSRNLPQFCEAPPGLRLLHKRFYIVQLQVLCLWSSVIILQEGTCSKCIVTFLLVFFNQVFWAYLQKNTPTVWCKHTVGTRWKLALCDVTRRTVSQVSDHTHSQVESPTKRPVLAGVCRMLNGL